MVVAVKVVWCPAWPHVEGCNVSVSTVVGLSTIPSSCVGVLVIGDCAIEVNEADLEWSNVYDGDTYVCTRLRCVTLSIVSNGPTGAGEMNAVSRLMNTIRSVVSQGYTVNSPLYFWTPHGNPASVGGVPTALLSSMKGVNPTFGSPSSYAADSMNVNIDPAFMNVGGMGQGQVRQTVTTPTDPSNLPSGLHYLPPVNFAFYYKYGFHNAPMLGSIGGHPTTSRVSSCGLFIPGRLMYKPIEIELVSLDSNVGSDMCSLRIIVSVYFNISPYHSNGLGANEPAYHKWSVSSRWHVGRKPMIIVSGRLVRRALQYGAPSLYEFLPHAMPGTRLVALDVASDDNSHSTTYSAVYELDYICVGLYPIAPMSGAYITPNMAKTLFSVAQFSLQEEAESVTQGSSFMSTLYEAALQKHSTDMSSLLDMLGSLGKLVEGVGEGVSEAIGAAGEAKEIKKQPPPGLSADDLKKQLDDLAANFRKGILGSLTSVLAGAFEATSVEVNRVVQQKSIDAASLEQASNGLVRTAHIMVVGYPGATIDDLQVAAYTVAKQVYLGWLAISCPPGISFGWRLSHLLDMAADSRSGVEKILEKFRNNITNDIPQAKLEQFFNLKGFGDDVFRQNQQLSLHRENESRPIDFYRELVRMFILAAPSIRSYIEPRWLADAPEDRPTHNLYLYTPWQSFFGRLAYGAVQEASLFERLTKVDDLVGLMLTFMGIHSVKAHVFVDHMVPIVKLTLTVVFRSADYNGLTLIGSLYSNLTRAYQEPPLVPASNQLDFVLSPSWFVPAIAPLCSSRAYQFIKTYAHGYISDTEKATRPRPFQNVGVAPDFPKIFHNLYVDIYKPNNETLLNIVTQNATTYNNLSKSMYAHGGSIGQGFQTPVIAPSYANGKPYLPGLGAGVVLSHFGTITTWANFPV